MSALPASPSCKLYEQEAIGIQAGRAIQRINMEKLDTPDPSEISIKNLTEV